MDHEQDFMQLLQSITQKSLNLITNLNNETTKIPVLIHQMIDVLEHVQTVTEILLQNPEHVWQMQLNFLNDSIQLFNSWLSGNSLPTDPRFSEEEWLKNPFFNLLSQNYLLAIKHINVLFETISYDDKNTAKKVQFFIKQYLDSLSPAHFIHTNPQIIAETLQSSGKNLLHGLHNVLSDLEKNPSQLNIKMTDATAFKLGKNIAATPGAVIYRNDMMELIQYAPQTDKVKSIPLLIIPPWINKYYILDLNQDNSLIAWLVAQGISVFVISWVNPDERFAKKSFFDYLNEGPKKAISIIQKQLNVPQVNALGFCIGGTLLTTLLAYNKAHQDNCIHSATFLAAMIDFSDPGDIAVFINEQQIKNIEEKMHAHGYLPGHFMASSFNSLRAKDLIWSFFIKHYLRGKNHVPFDILFWNADCTNMPALMHSQYLRWMYLENRLIKPGAIHLNHTPIDITSIDVPCFFVATEKDHIAPWNTVYRGFQLMNCSKRFILGGSGHIAGIVNAPNKEKYGYRTNNKTPSHAEKWLEQSTLHQGSWWPEWLKWLKAHSGRTIPTVDDLVYASLMNAPGSYVLKTSN